MTARAFGRTLKSVEETSDGRTDALRLLPRAHSLTLRLSDAGVDDDLIADCLEIDPAAVGPLLRVAEAKLAELLRELPGADPSVT